MDDDREFGETAVREGLISRDDLRVAVDAQSGRSLKDTLLTRGLLKPEDVQRIVDLLQNDDRRDAASLWDTLPALAGRAIPAGSTSPDDFLLGQIALEWKLVTPDQLVEALREQRQARGEGRNAPLGELLVERRWLQKADFERVLKEQVCRREGPPGIERYEVRERLGEGTAAVVYRAWDRDLGRPVAIKVLRSASELNSTARERFQREARAQGSISHPHVVTVHDVGEAGGRPYLVMELVDGKPLSARMEAGPISESEAVRLLERICRGVAAAHARGVVHRDLKPANILVSAGGDPKVGDFGLAHLTESSAELTKTGAVLGTPLYMSPEQVRGSAREITPRTDVYALGAILYELLTGRVPHAGETLLELYARISRDDPAPARALRPDLSRDVEIILLKALDKDPARRYADAGEMADDLKRLGGGEPIRARPASAATRLWRKASKHRAAVLPSVAAFLAVAAAGAWTLWSRGHADAELGKGRRELLEKTASEREARLLLEAPELEKVQGEVALAGDVAPLGMKVRPGDALRTGAGGLAILKYPDLARFEAGEHTTLRRPSDAFKEKAWILERGCLKTAARALVITPLARVELPDGEASVERAADSTRVEVRSGEAAVTRIRDGRRIAVPQGMGITIREAGELEVKPIVLGRLEEFRMKGGADASLIGHWKLDDGRGAVAPDSSGRRRDGTLIGKGEWVEGALRLDGAGQVALPKDPELDEAYRASFSMTAWFKPGAPPLDDGTNFKGYHALLLKGPYAEGLLYTGGHWFVMKHLVGPARDGAFTYNDEYPPGTWHHAAATMDSEKRETRLYIDARPRHAAPWGKDGEPQLRTSQPWRIGAHETRPETFRSYAKGEIADVRIYKRALDPEEVEVVYKAGGRK